MPIRISKVSGKVKKFLCTKMSPKIKKITYLWGNVFFDNTKNTSSQFNYMVKVLAQYSQNIFYTTTIYTEGKYKKHEDCVASKNKKLTWKKDSWKWQRYCWALLHSTSHRWCYIQKYPEENFTKTYKVRRKGHKTSTEWWRVTLSHM